MPTTLHPGVTPYIQSDSAELSALLTGAAIVPLDQTGWIRVTGEDRVRWLNGMVTNSIQDLAPGEGCYNFVLNAQGRIQGDLTAWMLEDSILLEIARDQIEDLTAYFDRFIIMDDVELFPMPEDMPCLTVVGPRAVSFLSSIGFAGESLAQMQLSNFDWSISGKDPKSVTIIHAHSPLIPRFELWSDAETFRSLTLVLIGAGAMPVHSEALEHLRIFEGTPLYGTDIRNTETSRDLPQETAQTRALHFSKGCYLGQEIVERIHSRGAVHRTFTGFELTGALPPTGTQLTADSDTKSIGELTSVASIPLPTGPVQLALGYVRREALDRALPIQYPGGTAVPIPLPYHASLTTDH